MEVLTMPAGKTFHTFDTVEVLDYDNSFLMKGYVLYWVSSQEKHIKRGLFEEVAIGIDNDERYRNMPFVYMSTCRLVLFEKYDPNKQKALENFMSDKNSLMPPISYYE